MALKKSTVHTNPKAVPKTIDIPLDNRFSTANIFIRLFLPIAVDISTALSLFLLSNPTI